MTNKNQTSPAAAGKTEVFSFGREKLSVRSRLINGEPWFVAKDIAKILQYSNPRKAILDYCKEKGVTICDSLTDGGVQKLKYINEGNMYRLIVNCTLPIADIFEEWIFGEVLPSIRKTGSYSAVPASRPVRLLPREQGVEWERFYAELTRCTTRADEELVAGLLKVSRKHVHDVATGRKRGYGVCCMLVDCAKENRAKGITRLVRDRAAEMDALRQELMSDFDGKEG